MSLSKRVVETLIDLVEIKLSCVEVYDREDKREIAGLELLVDDGKTIVDNVVFGSTAERQKIDFDFEIVSVEVETDRPPKQLFYIPALLLLALIVMLQRRRRDGDQPLREPAV